MKKKISKKKFEQRRILLVDNDDHFDLVLENKIEEFLIDLYNTGFNSSEREEVLFIGIARNKTNMEIDSIFDDLKQGVH